VKRAATLVTAVVTVLALALAVFLSTRPTQRDASNAPSPLLGHVAPVLAGPSLSDAATAYSLQNWRGSIVVVNFWSSWCGPCANEAPELSSFAWQHRGTVHVVGVVFNDSLGSAQAFSRRYGSLYPSIVDSGGVLANRYGVTSPPTTFVIDRAGRVSAVLLGATTQRQLSAVIARVR
jgi:cytochrome c biogenesis protein CcmG/thiol:disulfide interchange protein DsbE